jgi:hypothetical protein
LVVDVFVGGPQQFQQFGMYFPIHVIHRRFPWFTYAIDGISYFDGGLEDGSVLFRWRHAMPIVITYSLLYVSLLLKTISIRLFLAFSTHRVRIKSENLYQ